MILIVNIMILYYCHWCTWARAVLLTGCVQLVL